MSSATRATTRASFHSLAAHSGSWPCLSPHHAQALRLNAPHEQAQVTAMIRRANYSSLRPRRADPSVTSHTAEPTNWARSDLATSMFFGSSTNSEINCDSTFFCDPHMCPRHDRQLLELVQTIGVRHLFQFHVDLQRHTHRPLAEKCK